MEGLAALLGAPDDLEAIAGDHFFDDPGRQSEEAKPVDRRHIYQSRVIKFRDQAGSNIFGAKPFLQLLAQDRVTRRQESRRIIQ